MALPSPVAAFPDFGALVQENQARSQSLINSAWMNLQQNAARQAQKTAEVQAAAGYAAEMQAWNDAQGRPHPAGNTGSGPGPSGGSLGGGAGSGPMAAFLPLLDKTEGGGRYDTLFGHAQGEGGRFAGIDVSNMTLGELRQFASPQGEYGQWVKSKVGRVATPMGRHQIVGTTLFDTATAMGLQDSAKFTPAIQDEIAARLAKQALQRGATMGEKLNNLRGVWEGFKSVDDATLSNAIHQFESSRPSS